MVLECTSHVYPLCGHIGRRIGKKHIIVCGGREGGIINNRCIIYKISKIKNNNFEESFVYSDVNLNIIDFAMEYDKVSKAVIIHGGCDDSGNISSAVQILALNENEHRLYLFNPLITGHSPKRKGHSCVYIKEDNEKKSKKSTYIMFGGKSEYNQIRNDIFVIYSYIDLENEYYEVKFTQPLIDKLPIPLKYSNLLSDSRDNIFLYV